MRRVIQTLATAKEDAPVVFVSSFYRESEDYFDRWSSPLWRLRQDLAALNADTSFRAMVPEFEARPLTWVAEKSETQLSSEPDPLAVVDRLVHVLRRCDLYICILADHRHGAGDHGTPVQVHGKAAAVSYLEIELYAAAMYGKRISLYVLEGFSPGPRLQSLLHILEFAFPDWRARPAQKASEILKDVRELITRHASTQLPNQTLRRRLVRELYRFRGGVMGLSGVLFLDGAIESGRLPDLDLVEKLVSDYRQESHLQRKLNRLWFAARELMSASYQSADVQADSRLRDFLPLWDCVLGDWNSAASWHGWHGHMFAGTVAPLNSQAIIRAQGFSPRVGLTPEVILPPDGAMASACYSIAGLLGFGWTGWRCMQLAGRHVKKALLERTGPRDNLLAIRGSVLLRTGHIPSAIDDFTEMRRIRERENAGPLKIADALMHLGFAYACIPFHPQARPLLRASVKILEQHPDNPNLPRAMRKLALAHRMSGDFRVAKDISARANEHADRIAADDQIRRW